MLEKNYLQLGIHVKYSPCLITKIRYNITVLWYITNHLHVVQIRNTEIRCNKHNTRKIKILIVNHLNYNLVHDFWWSVLFCASKNSIKGKIPDVYYIKTWQPSLITQMNSDLLNFLEIVLHRFTSVLSLAYLFQFFFIVHKYFVYMIVFLHLDYFTLTM